MSTIGSMFNPPDRAALIGRVNALRPDSPRQWGKMTPAQMLAHCTAALGDACGAHDTKQNLIGKLIGRFAIRVALNEKPMQRNAPTAASYKIADDRDFEAERERLTAIVQRLAAAGPAGADGRVHVFFGRLTADQWGRLLYKHLDHHLRQFNA